MRDLQELPHPAFSHLLPEGEDKESNRFFSLQTIKFINEINGSKTLAQWQTALKLTKSKNPRPFWERGDHTSGGGGVSEEDKEF